MSYPKALPHDPILQIADDLFVVYGSIMLNPVMRITRNMTIVRHGNELTLINAVRLSEDGLQSLDALGEVKHVMRLGPLHGYDDEFYMNRYSPNFWGFDDGVTYTTPKVSHPLKAGGELPFPDAELVVFSDLKQTEGVIVLQRGSGVLLTADVLQTYSTPPHMPHTPWLVRKLMPFAGFPNETLLGPIWIKLLVQDKPQFEAEIRQVLEFKFDQMIAAHGVFLPNNAKQEVAAAIDKAFG